VTLSRREFIATAAALLLERPLESSPLPIAGVPARLSRKDCFFGLHFDLHPTAADTELGRDLTEEMISHLLDSCRPDFVQYDSKGHPGYLGFPSKTGMSAPGIVQDSLALWRRVTAARGVGLYNHFSGVLDGLAVAKHPEWARTNESGKRDSQQTSLFGPYEQELMIPELTEAALKYDLDGSWVDGDCWAVKPDYCDAAQRKFAELTGLETLPKKPEDKGWNEFLEMQREAFRQYAARYVEALHNARPGFQITSNWMYSTFAPERPTVPLDYLSGDLADKTAVRQARIQARYLSRCGKPWDLMSWGFESDEKFAHQSAKPALELQQEAAIVLAQGGAYQIYYVPTRAGWIDDRVTATATEVGSFCRQRQQWSHRSESLPEAGVLYSGRTLYRTANRPFGGWGENEAPAAGAVDLLLSLGYSVDLIPDWQAAESAERYPIIVVPDWRDIGDEAVKTITSYVANGGRLLLCGAENATLFSRALKLRFAGAVEPRTCFVADETGFAQLMGNWIEIDAPPSDVEAYAYRTPDTRKNMLPVAVRVNFGKGVAVVCPGPLASGYADATGSPVLRKLSRRILESLHQPMVRFDGDYPEVEVVLRKKNDQMLIHLINTAGAPVTSAFRHTGIVPRTGPIRLQLQLHSKPSQAILEPEGIVLSGEFADGEWRGLVPDLHVHAIIRIAEAVTT
jgi:hypothetical protein